MNITCFLYIVHQLKKALMPFFFILTTNDKYLVVETTFHYTDADAITI